MKQSKIKELKLINGNVITRLKCGKSFFWQVIFVNGRTENTKSFVIAYHKALDNN